MFRSFVAVAALAVAAFAARADDDNPFKTAMVGDFAIYSMDTKVAGISVNGTVKQTVTKKDDKEATVEVTGSIEFGGNKMDIPSQTQKIDLTKPFDPTKGANLPAGADAKIEKGKEGKEKVKAANGKEYDCTWTTYTVKAKVMNQDIDADVKAWTAKDVPTGMVKMTMTADIGGQKMEMKMELKQLGNKGLDDKKPKDKEKE